MGVKNVPFPNLTKEHHVILPAPVHSQGYYLDEWLVCALNQVQFDTYVSDTYSFAYLTYGRSLRHLKWVKTTKFLILRNGTSMSATNQHSSKWYPRLINFFVSDSFL